MAKISNLTTPDGTKYDIRATAIPFGKVDSTSTAKAFTATVPGISELTDGTCCYIMNGVVTSAENFTLNVNGLGAKPSYTNLAAATRDTTLFNISYTMLFVYNSQRISGGCWDCYRGYDSNTNTIGYQLRTNSTRMPMKSVTYRYRLLFTSADNQGFVPANNSSSTSATSSKTVCQDKIDPFGRIAYYGYTSSIAAGSMPGASYLWSRYVVTLGYSFNRTGAALELTSWDPVFVKCAPQSDGSAIIDSDTPYVQALPSTEDGKIYIFLGVATADTTMELYDVHPVYYYKDGAIRLWTNSASGGSDVSVSQTVTSGTELAEITVDGTGTKIFAPTLPTLATVATSGSYNDLSNKPDPLIGNTSEITPTQVYQAIIAGRDISVYLTDNTFGVLVFNSFNAAPDANVVVSNTILYVYGTMYCYQLIGWTSDNTWETRPDTLVISESVSSVNGQTGAVQLTASDVGALPSTTVIPSKTSDLTNDSGYLTGITSSDVTTALGYTPGTYSKPSTGIPASDLASGVIPDTSTFMVKGTDYVTAGQKASTTLGVNSTAEGLNTTASGEVTHAEGYGTSATGARSHAEGSGAVSGGRYSHAEGLYTIANGRSQHVFGEYNVQNGIAGSTARGTYVEIVGNGDNTTRSNARTLDWDGNEVLAGKLTVGAAPTNNMDVATKQYVDSAASGVEYVDLTLEDYDPSGQPIYSSNKSGETVYNLFSSGKIVIARIATIEDYNASYTELMCTGGWMDASMGWATYTTYFENYYERSGLRISIFYDENSSRTTVSAVTREGVIPAPYVVTITKQGSGSNIYYEADKEAPEIYEKAKSGCPVTAKIFSDYAQDEGYWYVPLRDAYIERASTNTYDLYFKIFDSSNQVSITISGEDNGGQVQQSVTVVFGSDSYARTSQVLMNTGGDISGNVTLKAAAGSSSPSLTFQRGTLTDNYNDWSIQDVGGYLRFYERGQNSGDWNERVVFNTTGAVTATTFSGQLSGTISSGTTATTQTAGDSSTKVATTAFVQTAITNALAAYENGNTSTY